MLPDLITNINYSESNQIKWIKKTTLYLIFMKYIFKNKLKNLRYISKIHAGHKWNNVREVNISRVAAEILESELNWT